jgi:hypothetical protein
MIEDEDIPRRDPVSENMALLNVNQLEFMKNKIMQLI